MDPIHARRQPSATSAAVRWPAARLSPADLRTEFSRLFAELPGPPAVGEVRLVRAPGRVNLIGEHTDYNDGFVLPMAIEPEVRVACRPRTDGVVRLASTAFAGEVVEFSVREPILPIGPEWALYSRGVIAQLVAARVPVVGMDVLVDNTLPLGAGLSSSAAVEVATAHAALTLAGRSMEPQAVALLCQKAEHEFPKVPCGIMDQSIVAAGMVGHAMLLDCRDLSVRHVPIDPTDVRVVIVNSMVRHALTGGEYAERRDQCQAGVAYFHQSRPEVSALRDVTPAEVDAAANDLPDVTFRRCRHVVMEIARTTAAADLLAAHDYPAVGRLMLASHASLRDDYEVSVPELDFLVDEATTISGVHGARMTGAGFGGCIVALVKPLAVEPLKAHITAAYKQRFNKTPEIYVTTATAGAGPL